MIQGRSAVAVRLVKVERRVLTWMKNKMYGRRGV